MSKKHKIKPAVAVNNRTVDPYITLGAGRVENDAFWRWGDDNLFPNALALMARRSVTHRPVWTCRLRSFKAAAYGRGIALMFSAFRWCT